MERMTVVARGMYFRTSDTTCSLGRLHIGGLRYDWARQLPRTSSTNPAYGAAVHPLGTLDNSAAFCFTTWKLVMVESRLDLPAVTEKGVSVQFRNKVLRIDHYCNHSILTLLLDCALVCGGLQEDWWHEGVYWLCVYLVDCSFPLHIHFFLSFSFSSKLSLPLPTFRLSFTLFLSFANQLLSFIYKTLRESQILHCENDLRSRHSHLLWPRPGFLSAVHLCRP